MRAGLRATAGLAAVALVALLASASHLSGSVAYTKTAFGQAVAPPRDGSVPVASLNRPSAVPGSWVTVRGSGFVAGSLVHVSFGTTDDTAKPEPLTKARPAIALHADRAGRITGRLQAPGPAVPGWTGLTLSGVAPSGQPLVEQVALDVVGPGSDSNGGNGG